MRGMTVPLTFYRHSTFFSAIQGNPCVITMGAAFEFPIFDTLVSRKFRRLPVNPGDAQNGSIPNGSLYSEYPESTESVRDIDQTDVYTNLPKNG